MNCESARNLFNKHLDGELSPSLETELAAHRLQCSPCRHELALMEVAGHVIAADSGSNESLNKGFTDRLLDCIDTHPEAGVILWYHRTWVRRASFAAAAVVGIALTSWMFKPGPQIAGERHTMPAPLAGTIDAEADSVEFSLAAETLVKQVGDTWATRADSAKSLIQLSRSSIQDILDTPPAEELQPGSEKPDSTPSGSFDELAPSVDGDEDIEDL